MVLCLGSDRIGLGKSQKRRTVVEERYQIVNKARGEELGRYPARNG